MGLYINTLSVCDIRKTEKEVIEVEKHIHNNEKWFGKNPFPTAETNIASRATGGVMVVGFTLTAGNSAFGSWIQILGSSDTPVATGKTKFDMHRFLVSGTNSTNVFIIQIVYGESADIAAKLSAEEFTEFTYVSGTNNNDSGISDVISKRVDAGTKVWARCACVGANGTTLAGFLGLHEYDV